jgi:hypothetical protein
MTKNQDQCDIDTTGRTHVDVTVTPLKARGRDLACAISGPRVKGGVLQLSRGQAHDLAFQLDTENMPDLQFLRPDENPFCSKVDGCPDSNDQVAQFESITLSRDGKTLRVQSEPGTEEVLHYALRMTDGRREYICDPIIIND